MTERRTVVIEVGLLEDLISAAGWSLDSPQARHCEEVIEQAKALLPQEQVTVHLRLPYYFARAGEEVKLHTACGQVAQETDVTGDRYREVTCPACIEKAKAAMTKVLDDMEDLP